jgi:hypothetical protein
MIEVLVDKMKLKKEKWWEEDQKHYKSLNEL